MGNNQPQQVQLEMIPLLFNASETVKRLERYIEKYIGGGSILSIYVNFRDALIHYAQISKLLNTPGLTPEKLKIDCEKQRHSIIEHLTRSYTDACVYILLQTGIKLHHLAGLITIHSTQKAEIIKHLHIVRNMLLDIRLAGADIERDTSIEIMDTINACDSVRTYLEHHGLWDQFFHSTGSR
ncbi:hypothetical protein FACS189493_3580 [Spirochaetia bacterium]|nr:hypothetical protein FACS189493_3580 [Spirochaetia bacterium]